MATAQSFEVVRWAGCRAAVARTGGASHIGKQTQLQRVRWFFRACGGSGSPAVTSTGEEPESSGLPPLFLAAHYKRARPIQAYIIKVKTTNVSLCRCGPSNENQTRWCSFRLQHRFASPVFKENVANKIRGRQRDGSGDQPARKSGPRAAARISPPGRPQQKPNDYYPRRPHRITQSINNTLGC